MRNDYFHQVKIIRLFGLAALLFSANSPLKAQLHCDGNRYINRVFTEIDSTMNVKYGENYTASGVFRDLNFDIYYPKQEFFFDRPLIILAHGGSFVSGSKHDMRLLCHEFAAHGFVCATVDYRLFDDFSQPLDSILVLDVVTKAVSDLRAVVRYFKENASSSDDFGIDTNFIFLGGASAGAIAAMQCAFYDQQDIISTTLDSVIQSNGGFQGNSSANLEYNSRVAGVLNYSGALKSASILDGNDPPFFGAHDDGDPTVPYGTAVTTELGTPVLVEGSHTIHTRGTMIGVRNQLVTIRNSNHHVSYFLDGPHTAKYKNVIDSTCRFLEYIICDRISDIESSETDEIKIYPNPSTGVFRVEGFDSHASYNLYDSQGRLIKTGTLGPNYSIDAHGLPPGLYQLCVQNHQGNISTQKIFVQ